MSDNIDTRVTPSLHPLNVREIDGYDDETATLLGPTETAFAHAYEQLGKVFDASAIVRADPTLTEAAAVAKAADFADRTFTGIAKRFDSAAANLNVVIAGIEKELSAPVESNASSTLSAEIRAYCKSLPQGERMSFVTKAIKDGDTRTASAILGGPAYLSGLESEMQSVLIRMFHEHHQPLMAKRLRAAKGALALIGERSGHVFTVLQQAVGADPHKVARIRAAAAKTAKAFAPEA